MANARELAWITASDAKNDRSDAEKLARLARADLRLLKAVDHDRQIAVLAGQHPEVIVIQSIPGVGALSALTFVLTLGRAERFEQSRDVGAFFGIRPKQRQSGDCDPQLHISKAGDNYMRKLLVQCAHHILGRFGKDSALRQWGLKIAQRGGKNALKRAIVAVARKLAVLMHRLWRKAEVFQPFPLAA